MKSCSPPWSLAAEVHLLKLCAICTLSLLKRIYCSLLCLAQARYLKRFHITSSHIAQALLHKLKWLYWSVQFLQQFLSTCSHFAQAEVIYWSVSCPAQAQLLEHFHLTCSEIAHALLHKLKWVKWSDSCQASTQLLQRFWFTSYRFTQA